MVRINGDKDLALFVLVAIVGFAKMDPRSTNGILKALADVIVFLF
jgi:hypothetical protein